MDITPHLVAATNKTFFPALFICVNGATAAQQQCLLQLAWSWESTHERDVQYPAPRRQDYWTACIGGGSTKMHQRRPYGESASVAVVLHITYAVLAATESGV